jgi:hypothetical protein
MQIGPEGMGRGTLSYATKIRTYDGILELEDFASSPVMLTEIEAEKDRD